jgi:glycosyltransferase involved in cell wall biosynthesis
MPVSRILLYSNAPWTPSGYGQQCGVWAPRLAALGHDVAIVAYFGLMGSVLNWNGITVYPGSSEDTWAQDVLAGYYGHHKADLLITLMDAWVLDPVKLHGMNVAHWLPVDAAASGSGVSPYLGSMDRRVLEEGPGRAVAMSLFGRQVLGDAGFSPLFVPHGIDTSVYVPPEDREALRDRLGLTGKYVIGINAANQDPVRKAFPEQMAAFAQFRQNHPDALLGIHSRTQTRNGVDLHRLAADLGITDSVVFADQFAVASGLMGAADLAKWYGVLDVLSNCSYGEGFGLPVLEAQSCGTPVIVTAFSAMAELCGSGWAVAGDPYWNRGHNAWWLRPSVPAIAAAYESAYEEAAGMREDARAFALRYDADRVLAEFWQPALKELLEPAAPASLGVFAKDVLAIGSAK